MNITKIYLIATLCNLLIFPLSYICFPGLRISFVGEDQFMENLTAITFFCCFSVGLFFILKLKLHYLYAAIPFIGLIAFLDEISFGERIFKFEAYVIEGFKFDGVHDILVFTKSKLSRLLLVANTQLQAHYYNLLILLIKIVLFLLTLIIVLFLVKNSKIILAAFKKYLPIRFVFASMLFLTISQIIDISEPGYEFLILMEELSEMNMALGLLFACFAFNERLFIKNNEIIK